MSSRLSKREPFSGVFNFGKKPDITRSHIRRVESLAKLPNAVLGQETLDQVG
jgi:hypothetical protein